MYILGLSPSWGTSRICQAWSPSEHQLTPSLSPIGDRVRSHTVRRRLFIFLMTAAHISPNVFPPEPPQQHTCTAYYDTLTSFILIIHHIHTSSYRFYLRDIFTLSLSKITLAGRLPSVLCVWYMYLSLISYYSMIALFQFKRLRSRH